MNQPVDMTTRIGYLTGAHGTVSMRHDPPDGDAPARWQAVCLAKNHDEDDACRSCEWAGPVRDHVSLAFDDALWHFHQEDGRCLYCEPCRRRIGLS